MLGAQIQGTGINGVSKGFTYRSIKRGIEAIHNLFSLRRKWISPILLIPNKVEFASFSLTIKDKECENSRSYKDQNKPNEQMNNKFGGTFLS